MTTPVEPRVDIAQYLWLSLVALLGSIARAGKWVDASGKFIISKLITEVAASVVFGVIGVAACAYMSWKPQVAGGIAGAAGLIGAAGVTGFIQNFASIRFGGKKNASDTKASGV